MYFEKKITAFIEQASHMKTAQESFYNYRNDNVPYKTTSISFKSQSYRRNYVYARELGRQLDALPSGTVTSLSLSSTRENITITWGQDISLFSNFVSNRTAYTVVNNALINKDLPGQSGVLYQSGINVLGTNTSTSLWLSKEMGEGIVAPPSGYMYAVFYTTEEDNPIDTFNYKWAELDLDSSEILAIAYKCEDVSDGVGYDLIEFLVIYKNTEFKFEHTTAVIDMSTASKVTKENLTDLEPGRFIYCPRTSEMLTPLPNEKTYLNGFDSLFENDYWLVKEI